MILRNQLLPEFRIKTTETEKWDQLLDNQESRWRYCMLFIFEVASFSIFSITDLTFYFKFRGVRTWWIMPVKNISGPSRPKVFLNPWRNIWFDFKWFLINKKTLTDVVIYIYDRRWFGKKHYRRLVEKSSEYTGHGQPELISLKATSRYSTTEHWKSFFPLLMIWE